MGFFSGLAFWTKRLFRGMAWPASQLRSDRKMGRATRWTLHFVAVVCLLIGLGLLNQWCGLDRLLRTPWPVLRAVWLPLIFLSLYLAGWFAWWLSRLLRTPPEGSEWPDIELAWQRAVEAVEHAGIDMRAVPVYLVLGRPAGEMRSLFAAAKVPLSVPQTPRDPNAPLHLFANSEAVYIACAKTSLLGRQASWLAENTAPSETASGTDDPDEVQIDDLPLFTGEPARHAADDPLHSTEHSLDQAVALLVKEPAAAPPAAVARAPKPRPSLLEQADVIERTTSRLQFLCTLIARDRQPYCPVNGLLLLLPLAASADELTAGQTAVLLERDLTTVRRSFDVRCPLTTLICDLEATPGGQELLARFPQDQRHRRLGVSFPLLAQCDSARAPEMIQTGIRWLCRELVSALVYRLAKVRGGQDAAAVDWQRVNTRLYHLLTQLREGESRLERLLTRAICPDGKSPWMVTGCYLAATGDDAVRGQGFAGGIFPQLLQVQNHVAWTRGALDDDRFCRRLAVAGYAAMAVSVAVAVAAAVVL